MTYIVVPTGVLDGSDNCPTVHNSDQANSLDSDSIGDACDNCAHVDNDDQLDTNDNWLGDACDVPGASNIDK